MDGLATMNACQSKKRHLPGTTCFQTDADRREHQPLTELQGDMLTISRMADELHVLCTRVLPAWRISSF